MRVFDVEDGMKVQPNCAHIIPQHSDMAFLNGALQLLKSIAPRGRRLPINFLFCSLAQDLHKRAICVLISGTGSDATLGQRAIKGAGGMAIVQSPNFAEYDGMPRRAIDTGLVGLILPPIEMAGQLIGYVSRCGRFSFCCARIADMTFPLISRTRFIGLLSVSWPFAKLNRSNNMSVFCEIHPPKSKHFFAIC